MLFYKINRKEKKLKYRFVSVYRSQEIMSSLHINQHSQNRQRSNSRSTSNHTSKGKVYYHFVE